MATSYYHRCFWCGHDQATERDLRARLDSAEAALQAVMKCGDCPGCLAVARDYFARYPDAKGGPPST